MTNLVANSQIAAIMKSTTRMYKEVLEKRLQRKREKFNELLAGGIQTPDEKRMFVELKATIEELESVIDIADTLLEHQADDK